MWKNVFFQASEQFCFTQKYEKAKLEKGLMQTFILYSDSLKTEFGGI